MVNTPELKKDQPPVFVSGATGFIGGELTRLFLEQGVEVRSVTSNPNFEQTTAPDGLSVEFADISKDESMGVIMEQMNGCQTIFHCAGVNTFCRSDSKLMEAVNEKGTANVIRTATLTNGVRRGVYLSSVVTIGEKPGEVANEDTIRSRGQDFLSDYEKSKYYAEITAKNIAKDEIDLITLKPASVQGPGRATGTARMILKALNGERQYLPPETMVSIVDVRDCVAGIIAAGTSEKSGEDYILSGFTTSFKDAVKSIEELTGVNANVKFVSDRKLNALGFLDTAIAQISKKPPKSCREFRRTLLHGSIFDGSKAVDELGITYRSREETLTDTINWLIGQGLVKRALPGFLEVQQYTI